MNCRKQVYFRYASEQPAINKLTKELFGCEETSEL